MTRVAFFPPSGERRIVGFRRLTAEFRGPRRLAEAGQRIGEKRARSKETLHRQNPVVYHATLRKSSEIHQGQRLHFGAGRGAPCGHATAGPDSAEFRSPETSRTFMVVR